MSTTSVPTGRHLVAHAAASVALGAILLAGGGALGTLVAGPAAASAMAPITVAGRVTKVTSTTSFTISVKAKRYVVKVDAMTHLRDNGKTLAFKSLMAGDDVTVKGPLEMGEISATSVVITSR